MILGFCSSGAVSPEARFHSADTAAELQVGRHSADAAAELQVGRRIIRFAG